MRRFLPTLFQHTLSKEICDAVRNGKHETAHSLSEKFKQHPYAPELARYLEIVNMKNECPKVAAVVTTLRSESGMKAHQLKQALTNMFSPKNSKSSEDKKSATLRLPAPPYL